MLKSKIRKRILKLREKVNRRKIKIDFDKVVNLLKQKKISKKNIGGYFPVNFEIDDLELLKKFKKKILIFLCQ